MAEHLNPPEDKTADARPDEGLEIAVLAAGLSQRMGPANKLLVALDGMPLIRRTVLTYLEVTQEVSVILGHEADAVRAALEGLNLRFVTNRDYETGQQSSVQTAMATAALTQKGIMIALADQPALTALDILSFQRHFHSLGAEKILVPYHNGTRGNPVIFPSALIAELRKSDPSPNYRRYIDSHPEQVARYDAPNNHFTLDIDTPEALADFMRAAGRG